jgi:hypothetical protein
MSDQHSQRAASLEARLTDVKMEIDDDDEDVVLATFNLTNEAAIPMGGLEINITTSDGQEVSAKEGITSLGPGVTRTFTFEFPLDNGQWTFSTTSSGKKITLGPYDADFTYQEDEGRKLNNAIGSNLFTGAFTEHLSDFGNTEEKEIIDSSTIVLTTYHGENAEGGATKINVGIAEEEEEEEGEEEEESPRTPPWEKLSAEETVPDPLSAPLNQPANEVRNPPWENNGLVAQEAPSAPVDLLSLAATTTVATETEIAPVQDSPAPTGPPAVPSAPASKPPAVPSAPASKPPAVPSKPAPTGPPAIPSAPAPTGPPAVPSAPASKPPAVPSSPAPAGPPSGPPSNPPAGPPSGPPSNPPAGPPSGPPSSSPAGPPSASPSGPPSGPPAKPGNL